jgi:hypothetical protein
MDASSTSLPRLRTLVPVAGVCGAVLVEGALLAEGAVDAPSLAPEHATNNRMSDKSAAKILTPADFLKINSSPLIKIFK